MANQVYFRKLDQNDPFDKERIAEGQDWSWFGETNSYMCPNLEYQATLATIDFFQNEYKKPILGTLSLEDFGADKESIKKMVEFEKEFYSSNYVTEENFDKLKNVYFAAYGLIKKNSLDLEKVPEKEKILERGLTMERKLVNMPKVLNRVLLFLQGTYVRDKEIIKEQKIGLENFRLSFLTTRSTYSLLFFPFTISVWRSDDHPDYLEKETIDILGTKNQFMTLDQAGKSYSAARIKSWYTVFIEQLINRPN